MTGIAFDPDVREEFLAAVEYYEECKAGLGRRFREAVESQLGGIAEMPFRYRVLHEPFRRALVPNFPYASLYAIEPTFILVVAWLMRSENRGIGAIA